MGSYLCHNHLWTEISLWLSCAQKHSQWIGLIVSVSQTFGRIFSWWKLALLCCLSKSFCNEWRLVLLFSFTWRSCNFCGFVPYILSEGKWIYSCLLFCNDLLNYSVQRLGVLDTLSTNFFQINDPLMPLTWLEGLSFDGGGVFEQQGRTEKSGELLFQSLWYCTDILSYCWAVAVFPGSGSFHNRYGKDSQSSFLLFSQLFGEDRNKLPTKTTSTFFSKASKTRVLRMNKVENWTAAPSPKKRSHSEALVIGLAGTHFSIPPFPLGDD